MLSILSLLMQRRLAEKGKGKIGNMDLQKNNTRDHTPIKANSRKGNMNME